MLDSTARLARVLTFLALASTSAWLLGACTRPGEKRCAEVCEHYLELYVDAEWSEKIAQTTGDERAQLERDKTEARRSRREDPDKGFETCVNRCNRRARGEVADCVMKATDLAQAKKCDAEDEGCRVSTDSRSGAPWLVVFLALIAVARVRSRTKPVGRKTRRA